MPINTSNISPEIFEEPSEEVLGKLSKENAEFVKIAHKKAKSVADSSLKLLKEEKQRLEKIKSEENEKRLRELEEREQQIKDGLDIYSLGYPKPTIKKDLKKGKVFAEHGNKLGYIFIGDTKKAVISKVDGKNVNSPKISMVIGGGLEASFLRKENKSLDVDPTDDEIIGSSAEFSLMSMYDIDTDGILTIPQLKNRSTIKAKADALELSAKEIVIIRSKGEAYFSNGDRMLAPGGVHIISGVKAKSDKYIDPEPMVLGKKLSDALIEVVDQVAEINSAIISISEDIMNLKQFLSAHTHISPVGPTSPSAELIASILPTISKTIINFSNGYSRVVNLEMLKTNRLLALSSDSFMSTHNRVN